MDVISKVRCPQTCRSIIISLSLFEDDPGVTDHPSTSSAATSANLGSASPPIQTANGHTNQPQQQQQPQSQQQRKHPSDDTAGGVSAALSKRKSPSSPHQQRMNNNNNTTTTTTTTTNNNSNNNAYNSTTATTATTANHNINNSSHHNNSNSNNISLVTQFNQHLSPQLVSPHIVNPSETADLLYEYFPLGLDDWQAPVDAVYRPHVVHHMNMPDDPKAIAARSRSKRYFAGEAS